SQAGPDRPLCDWLASRPGGRDALAQGGRSAQDEIDRPHRARGARGRGSRVAERPPHLEAARDAPRPPAWRRYRAAAALGGAGREPGGVIAGALARDGASPVPPPVTGPGG